MLTPEELQQLKECNGVHNSLQEIFNCASCNLILEDDDNE